MESFFFAEVMKYLYVSAILFEEYHLLVVLRDLFNSYLTFDDPNHISLDEWVFNTEGG